MTISQLSTIESLNNEKMLGYQLIQAQTNLRQLAKTDKNQAILILVNGMENAGKGDAVKFLTNLMDARHIKVHATMGQHPSPFQPIWQRHCKPLPKKGEIVIYFGNWYADLIRQFFDNQNNMTHKKLRQLLENIQKFEQDLINNGIQIIKCWFSVNHKTLKNRLHDDIPAPEQLYHINWHKAKNVKKFLQFSEILFNIQADWHIIDGTNPIQTNYQFAKLILDYLQNLPNHQPKNVTKFNQSPIPKRLIQPNSTILDKATYKKILKIRQKQFTQLLRQRGQRHIILVFEGMDASGKGGTIKRLVQMLDPREFIIYPISAPTNDEKSYPYLWRFWTRLPHDELATVDIENSLTQCKQKNYLKSLKNQQRNSRIVIFDRSWYGRILVERVENLAKVDEWQRAYGEIQRFEQDLQAHQAIVVKFWLAISQTEQLKRFQARQNNPNKQHKITDEDWRNRSKWQHYIQACSDMLHLTDDWHVIATDDKYTARLQVLETLIDQLNQQLTN